MAQQSECTLLTIPSEIRALIFSHVARGTVIMARLYAVHAAPFPRIPEAPLDSIPQSLSLLLVNQQAHDEFARLAFKHYTVRVKQAYRSLDFTTCPPFSTLMQSHYSSFDNYGNQPQPLRALTQHLILNVEDICDLRRGLQQVQILKETMTALKTVTFWSSSARFMGTDTWQSIDKMGLTSPKELQSGFGTRSGMPHERWLKLFAEAHVDSFEKKELSMFVEVFYGLEDKVGLARVSEGCKIEVETIPVSRALASQYCLIYAETDIAAMMYYG